MTDKFDEMVFDGRKYLENVKKFIEKTIPNVSEEKKKFLIGHPFLLPDGWYKEVEDDRS